MKAIKHSKQRDSIKTCLMGRRDHPTADAVYMSIREEFPNSYLLILYEPLPAKRILPELLQEPHIEDHQCVATECQIGRCMGDRIRHESTKSQTMLSQWLLALPSCLQLVAYLPLAH